MSEDKKSEDWEMSLPHKRLDDDVREFVEEKAAPEADPEPADGWGATESNISLEPITGSDDWGVADTRKTTEDKVTDWKMPEPVFRVSPGETPHFDDDDDFASDFGESAASAEVAPPVPQASAAPDPKPLPKASRGGAGKWILLLVGIFAVMAVVAVIIVAGYFMWFTGSSQVTRTTSNTNAPLSKSAPTPGVSDDSSPRSINIKGEMVLVEGGEFTMGSDAGPDESRPAHKVTVDAFYIDKFEVTNAQYKEFCDATGHAVPPKQIWDENYFLTRPNAPVVGISYDDAKAYAEWAGKRLPTEAEWEKAASWNSSTRTKSAYPWGDTFDRSRAAFGVKTPMDVGEFASGASPSGALDMAGNALEWVDGFFEAYPGSTASNPEFGNRNRIVRGGFIASKSDDLLMTTKRIFVRADFLPTADRDSYIGFRCAVSANDARVKNAGSK